MMPQSVKKQDVETLQLLQRLFRHAAEVGKVGRAAEAISFNGHIAVYDGQRLEGRAEKLDRPVHRPQLNLRQSSEFVVSRENVAKDIAQNFCRIVTGEQRNLLAAGDTGKAERPDIIKPENVVGMTKLRCLLE